MDYYNSNGPMMNGNDAGWGVFMMLFWIVVLIVVVYVVISLVKNHKPTSNTKLVPIEIAKERYAKGKITKKDFDQLKKDLK